MIKVLLKHHRVGMSVTERLPGATDGFPEEWLSLV